MKSPALMISLIAALLLSVIAASGPNAGARLLCDIIHTDVPLGTPPAGEGVGPAPTTAVSEIAVAQDGSLWGVEADASRLVHITTTGVVKDFPVKASVPVHIATGPNGSVFFTESKEDLSSESLTGALPFIGELAPSGTIVHHPIPKAATPLDQIAVGPANVVWFVSGDRIGRWAGRTEAIIRRVAQGGATKIYRVDKSGRAFFSVTSKGAIIKNGVIDSNGAVSVRDAEDLVDIAAALDGSTTVIQKRHGLAVCGATEQSLVIKTTWCSPTRDAIDQFSAIDSFHAVAVYNSEGHQLVLTEPSGSQVLYETPDYVGFLASGPGGRVWFSYGSGGNPNHFISGRLCSSKASK